MDRPNQFDEFEPSQERNENRPEACLVCEALCPDAVDGTLTEAERKAFDKHIAGCAHCAQELEDAQRGAAWLGLLKSKAPEPPATLLARILAETTGITEKVASSPAEAVIAPASTVEPEAPVAVTQAAHSELQAAYSGLRIVPKESRQEVVASSDASGLRGKVLSFSRGWRGVVPSASPSGISQGRPQGTKGGGAFHPRLAMTAAMAFFSIALTLNLTGVRLRDFDAEKLQPRALQRTAAAAEASAVRSFQNLKVVYQVESRVSELRQDPLWESQADASRAPEPAKKQEAEKTDRDRGQD